MFAGRAVEIKTDRATCRDLFGGNHSANYESVAEQHAARWLQYAEHFDQQIEPGRNVAQHIVRKGRVKRLVVEREIFRNVALFETCARSEGSCLCEFFRATDSRFVYVHSHNPATDFFREV